VRRARHGQFEPRLQLNEKPWRRRLSRPRIVIDPFRRELPQAKICVVDQNSTDRTVERNVRKELCSSVNAGRASVMLSKQTKDSKEPIDELNVELNGDPI
jgi:hypothetical protein